MDSRGGIQPYLALGVGLSSAGHEVRVIAPSDFASMIAERGLSHAPITGDVEAAVRASGGTDKLGGVSGMRYAAQQMEGRVLGWTRETLEGCEGVDMVTGGIGGMVLGLSVAEKLGVPFIETQLQPLGAPSDTYPGVLFPGTPRWLGRWGRRMSHRLSELGVWMPFEGAMKKARAQVLGLTGRARAADGQPVLYGFSRHVVDVPSSPDRERHVTGYWTLPAAPSWRPPVALERFLERSGPVVSLGFGSMASEDPAAVTALVLGAIRKAGVRAVLLSGWGGLTALTEADDVFCADALPHDWLFPRVRAVVHHGGAGTTGAGLRAGVPSIVVPFGVDQPFWGSRVERLGAGPKPIPRAKLTEQRLADALARTVTDEAMRARAAELGETLRGEDGVASAVAIFDRMASSVRSRRRAESATPL
jgi:UDP:flavonoid glycosyltransferase YjiC (YdhE family)